MSGSTALTSGRRPWLPRFGLRTLIVLFTAVSCLIPIAWQATETRGEDDVSRRYMRFSDTKFGGDSLANAAAVFPFLVRVTMDHQSYPSLPWTHQGLVVTNQVERFHCVWLFGLVIKVPFTTSIDKPSSVPWGSARPQPAGQSAPPASATKA